MNLLEQFVDFLLNQKNEPSLSTIKNYRADVGQFINWFEQTFHLPFYPSKITSQILYDYKKTRDLSKSSVKRHLSSLRKFFDFLKKRGLIVSEPFPSPDYKSIIDADPLILKNFKNFLYEYKKSPLTIKNYISDIKNFFTWLKEAALLKQPDLPVKDKYLLNKITFSVIEEYKQRLIAAKFSPATINRKLSSLRSYTGWTKNQGLIGPVQTDFPVHQSSNIKKEFYAPLRIPARYLPTHKKIWYFIRYTRPNWYKKYHSYPFTHYFHFTIFTILSCAVGFGIYGSIFASAQRDDAILGTHQELIITSVSNSPNENLTNVGDFWEVAIASIKTSLINASEVITNSLTATLDTTQSKVISPIADTE
jgi:site-specific recombinase XerD